MTNELGTTLKDIEANAERKQEAMRALQTLYFIACGNEADTSSLFCKKIIRKYIKDN